MIILGILLILLAILGAPLFTVIASSAMLGYLRTDVDLMAVAIEFLGLADESFLAAIPMFTFVGFLLSKSNVVTEQQENGNGESGRAGSRPPATSRETASRSSLAVKGRELPDPMRRADLVTGRRAAAPVCGRQPQPNAILVSMLGHPLSSASRKSGSMVDAIGSLNAS